MRSHPFLRKAAGCILIVVSVLLFYFIIPVALSLSFFIMYFICLPIIAVGVIGYSLIARLSFKKFLEWLVSAIIVTLLPWIVILPSNLQILSGILLIIGLFVLVLYGYFRINEPSKLE